MGLPVRGQRTRTQVSTGKVVGCSQNMLTIADRNGEKVEQDRKRRIRSCADVRGLSLECIILYCTTWSGVYWDIYTGTAAHLRSGNEHLQYQ